MKSIATRYDGRPPSASDSRASDVDGCSSLVPARCGEPEYLLGDARQAVGGALHFVAFQFDPQCAELRGKPLQNFDDGRAIGRMSSRMIATAMIKRAAGRRGDRCGGKVAHAFGLRWKVSDELRAVEEGCGMDLAAFNSDPSWTLTMPAQYVVASDGMIDGYYKRSLGWPGRCRITKPAPRS